MNKLPVVLVADNIRSLVNIGSLFRIADALGMQEIFLVGICGYPDMGEQDSRRPFLRARQHLQIQKSALESIDAVPFRHFPNLSEALAEIERRDLAIVSIEQSENSIPYTQIEHISLPCALVVGNEVEGVSQEFVEKSETILEIPMHGQGKSLNAAVSVGIVGYELLKKMV